MMGIILAVVVLGLATSISMRAAFNMIERKDIVRYFPSFFLGIITCISAGFIFHSIFDVAIDIYLSSKLVFVIGVLHAMISLKGDKKK